MNTAIIIAVVVVVVAIVLISSIASEVSRRRSMRLQQRFGPEYEHMVEETGDRRRAESELHERETRHERLQLRTLPPDTRERYRQEWDGIQRRFVDVPGQAVLDADRLVQVIMRDIGYPTDDFEQRAADLSVDHPEVVQHFRAGHAVADAQQRGQAETEPLRQAVTDYRILVDELLSVGAGQRGGEEGRDEDGGEQ